MNKIYAFFFISLLALSCSKNNRYDEMILSFDISRTNQQIVYSILKEGFFKLYTSNIKGENLKPLTLPQGYSYLSPKFSQQGDKIIYVMKNDNQFEYSIVIYNIKSQEQKIVMTTSDAFIGEAIISDDLQFVYFTMAKGYQSNSPLSQGDLKGFDLYQLSLLNNETRSMTNLEAYGMMGLFDYNEEAVLLNIQGSTGGIYLCSKEELNKIAKVNLMNEKGQKRMDLFYTNFYMIAENSFIAENNFQITKISFNDKTVTDIYLSDNQIKCLSYYNNQIYIVTDENALVLKIISMTGKLKKEIQLKFN